MPHQYALFAYVEPTLEVEEQQIAVGLMSVPVHKEHMQAQISVSALALIAKLQQVKAVNPFMRMRYNCVTIAKSISALSQFSGSTYANGMCYVCSCHTGADA